MVQNLWLTLYLTGVVKMNSFINSLDKPEKDFYNHSYISLKNRYFFHSVGKAANSTVKHYLYNEELKGTGIKYKTVHERLNSPLISPFQLDSLLLNEVLLSDKYFHFTFVRNPYSRILSCFLDRIQNINSAPYKELVRWAGREIGYNFTFSEFVALICEQSDCEQNNHWRLQYADAMCGAIKYDFIGKQETFDNDMKIIWKSLFPESSVKDFSKINKSPAKTGSKEKLHEYWNQDLISKVADRYKADFEYFDYNKLP